MRFDERTQAASALAGLRAISSVDRTGHTSCWVLPPPESSDPPFAGSTPRGPVAGLSHEQSLAIDLTSATHGRGVRAGEVVGLMFQLGSGETIDTLIDDRLARGDVRPEVEVTLPTGVSVWAVLARRISFTPRASDPAESTLVRQPLSGRVERAGTQPGSHPRLDAAPT